MVQIGPIDVTGPNTRFIGYAEVIDQSDDASLIRFYAQCFNGPGGNSSSFYGGFGDQLVTCDSLGIGVYHAGNPFLPSGYAQNQLRWNDYQDHWVEHDSEGYLGPLSIRMTVSGSHSFTYYATLYVDRLAQIPPAPSPIGLDQITTTSMRYRFNGTGDGGASIIRWEVQYSKSATFSSGNTLVTSPGTMTHSPLDPGTRYYFRSRGVNSVGNGVWSSVSQADTLPAVAPGLSVAPSLSGQSAVVTLSPPGGVSGVTEYNLEWRLGASGTVTALSSAGNTFTINGLTPGQVYQYRANAEIGSYTSPWTSWTPVSQPNPNTNPGDFYDGSTTDTSDTDYGWVGATGNSQSTATFKNVLGWRTFTDGNATSGGTGVVAQVTGGFTGLNAARVTFHSDATAAGFIAGISYVGAAEATPGSTYFGNVHVRLPLRTQRLEPGVAWIDAANAIISITWSGTAAVVAPSATVWTRLEANGVAPANTVKAAPVVRDVTGTSWSLWLGGDQMLLDGAMISLNQSFPYFDGSTLNSPTFTYEWLGTENNSESVRYGVVVSTIDPLLDPDCPPIPAPPAPPVILSDCIEEVGVWRRYMVQVPAGEVRQWSSTLPTLLLTTGASAERQVRIRFYENPLGIAPDLIDTSMWEAEMILTYIPPATVLTLDAVTQRVRAEVAGGAPLAANQLLYGTGGIPATWPELRCGIGYVITLDVPTDAPAGNLNTRVLLTQRV